MSKTKLSDIGKIITGNTPKTSDSKNYDSNDIPFVKPSDIFDDEITSIDSTEYWISECARDKARVLPKNSILVTCIGIIGKVGINTVECAFNQQINAIVPDKEKCIPKYISYAILHKQQQLQDIANAPVVPIINKTQFSNIEVEIPSVETQTEVVSRLDRVSQLIYLQKQALEKLDELIKSRFVEMFGDPTCSECLIPLTHVCEIIDGDRGKNYPKQEDFSENGYCLFLNAKNVTQKGFDLKNCMFISKEKDEKLRKGKLKKGDIILTTRGTVGNLAYYNDDIPYEHIRINSGMVIIRIDRSILNEVFFIEQFKFQIDTIKQTVANGSAQPQLPISKMNKIQFIIPLLDLQNQFADFVEQVENQKSAVQQSIEKLEILKKSLMQEYFG